MRFQNGISRENVFWAIVLAGGEGSRLRPLIRRLYGDDRPKQFASLIGSRSLLRATLDRVARKVSLEETVVVTSCWHDRYVALEFSVGPQPRLLVQPRDRGTAAGVLLPVHWVKQRDAEAVLAVFPADHFVTDEAAFMNHVGALAALARRHPDRLFLVGATPMGPEPGYGWIEPAGRLNLEGSQEIWGVRRFWEKPSTEVAQSCFENGYLWNTFVMVGSAAAFIEAGRRFVPRLEEELAKAAPFVDTPDEQAMIERAYSAMPTADFSRAIFEARPPFLAVSRLPAVGWTDLGTPERVVRSLGAVRISRSPALLSA